MADENDDLPIVKAWRGLIADYRNGLIDAETLERALETLTRPDVAVSLGAVGVDSGMLDAGYDGGVSLQDL